MKTIKNTPVEEREAVMPDGSLYQYDVYSEEDIRRGKELERACFEGVGYLSLSDAARLLGLGLTEYCQCALGKRRLATDEMHQSAVELLRQRRSYGE